MTGRNACTWAVLIILLVSICCPEAATADTQKEQGPELSVTPRFWLSMMNPLVGVMAVKEAYLVPTYGATLSFRPAASNYTFLLSGWRGEGDGDALIPGSSLESSLDGVPIRLTSGMSAGKSEGERTDFEFLIKRAVPDKWYSLHFGFRYVSWREISSGRAEYALHVGPVLGQTFHDEQSAELAADLESNYYGLEMGFGTLSQLSRNGQHSLFTEFTFAFAYTEWKTTVEVSQNLVPMDIFLDFLDLPDTELSGNQFATGLDFAAGYQYRGDHLGFSLRYRALVVLEENALELPQLTAISGPEVLLSIIF